MIKLRHVLLSIVTLGSIALLTACNTPMILDPKGMIAAHEKQLMIDALLLMLTIVVPVIILTLLIARKYRASNTKAKYSPNWAHGTALEAGWWILPIIIISVLGTMTWRTTHELDPYKPLDVPGAGKPVTIQVIALDWKWLFIYPDQNIATINYIDFPVNTPVNFLITSDAPMNSFQIPQLGGQIYAMAGMQTKLHLIANAPGDYKGRSVSFSGEGFTGMTFIAHAGTQQEFDAWVKSVKASKNTLDMNTYNQLVQPSENNPVMLFSSVTNNLFANVIMKYMGPDMSQMSNDQNTMQHSNKN